MPFIPPSVSSGGQIKASDINLLGTQYPQAMADSAAALSTGLATKADLVGGKVPASQLPPGQASGAAIDDTTPSATTVFSSQKSVASFAKNLALYAADYGLATGNTAAQNDTAIAAAITAAQAAGNANILFPRGTFNVSAPINAKSTNTYGDGIGFFGQGRKSTVFVNQTDTSDLLWVGGYNNYFRDFTIRHASFNPTSTTGDGLVFFKCAYSTFERIQINETGKAVAIAQVGVNEPGTSSGNAANWMFSCTFDSINVTRFSKNALFLNSYVGGSTGSHWRNVYLQNVSTGGAQVTSSGNAIDILNCDFTGDQINVEDGLNTASLLANGQSNVVISTLHLERINVAAGTNSIVRAYGGAQVSIGNLSYAFSNAGVSGSGNTSLVSAAYYGQMQVGSIELNNNVTLTAGTYTIGEVTDSGNSATLEFGNVASYQSPAYAALTNSTANAGLLRAGGKWWGSTVASAGNSFGKLTYDVRQYGDITTAAGFTAAVNAWITAMGSPTSMQTLFIPNGAYSTVKTGTDSAHLSSYAFFWGSNLGMVGESELGTVIQTPADGSLIYNSFGTTQLHDISFQNFSIDGSLQVSGSYTTALKGIFIQDVVRFHVKNMTFSNIYATALGADFLQDYNYSNLTFIQPGRAIREKGLDPSTVSGGSAIGLGTGKYQVEAGVIDNIIVHDAGRAAIFYEKQGSGSYYSQGHVARNITAINCWAGLHDCGADGLDLEMSVRDSRYGVFNEGSTIATRAGRNGNVRIKAENNSIADLYLGYCPEGGNTFEINSKSGTTGVLSRPGVIIGPKTTVRLEVLDNHTGPAVNIVNTNGAVQDLTITGRARGNASGITIDCSTKNLHLNVDVSDSRATPTSTVGIYMKNNAQTHAMASIKGDVRGCVLPASFEAAIVGAVWGLDTYDVTTPTGLVAAAGDAQVALSWTAPSTSTPTDYVIQQKVGSGSYAALTRTASTTPSQTVTGLTNGTVYSYRVASIVAGVTGAFSAVATATPAAATVALTNTTAPAVTPTTATTGSTLTTTNGTWSATPDSYTYQWYRAGSAISGATSATYVLVSADVANAVTCNVTAVKAGYTTATAASNAVTSTAGSTPALTNSTAPAVTGTGTIGQVLTSTNGTWSATPDSYTYQWKRSGTAISGATASTYTLVTADGGTTVTCTVTAVKSGYTSGTATSNGIAVAAAASGVVISDSFNRTGSTLGSSDGGTAAAQAWQSTAGTGQNTDGNTAGASSGGLAVNTLDAGVADGRVSMKYGVQNPTVASRVCDMVFRYVDDSNYYYIGAHSGAAATYAISKRKAGTSTVIYTMTATSGTDGDLIEVLLNGQAVSVYLNGTLVYSPTNQPDFSTATRHGFRTLFTTDPTSRVDSFAVATS